MNEEEERFFRIPYQEISRDDVKAWMIINKTLISDEALSNEFMQGVANEMGNLLVDKNWLEVLDEAVREICDLLSVEIFEEDEK